MECIVAAAAGGRKRGVTSSSTAEYFSKNLQQVGFSSPTKAVLTTLKEAMDNALDACEDHGIAPDLTVRIEKLGAGSLRNTDKIKVIVTDNGPGIDIADVPRVFGEYLASSKFGRGRCSRGQQGIGISAATTWALQTAANGARVITKTKGQRKATSCVVGIDLKNNKGKVEQRQSIDWDPPHGTSVEFVFDGRVQLNGEGGVLAYLRGNVLVNPHMRLTYQLLEDKPVVIDRVTDEVPDVPEAVEPHPHTMKLGEFISHARLFGRVKVNQFLKTGFSRLPERVIQTLPKLGKFPATVLNADLQKQKEEDFRKLYSALQAAELLAPSTKSVISVGEEVLAKSIMRLGDIDFFSVVTRKPTICDFKPVQVEVAVARLSNKGDVDGDDPSQVLRFANRVPLQFDKAGCAIVKAINSVNWKSYGLRQPKGSLPIGPYIIAVSVVSPFIKFKNASKETIDASDELVDEIRRALMQCGQKLSKHLRREHKEAELEEKIRYVERFAPILVETLVRITGAGEDRKKRAEEGLVKILGRDTQETKKDLKVAESRLAAMQSDVESLVAEQISDEDDGDQREEVEELSFDREIDEESPKPQKSAKKAKGQKKTKTKSAAGESAAAKSSAKKVKKKAAAKAKTKIGAKAKKASGKKSAKASKPAKKAAAKKNAKSAKKVAKPLKKKTKTKKK